MLIEVSLPCLQEPATRSYPELGDSNPDPHIVFLSLRPTLTRPLMYLLQVFQYTFVSLGSSIKRLCVFSSFLYSV